MSVFNKIAYSFGALLLTLFAFLIAKHALELADSQVAAVTAMSLVQSMFTIKTLMSLKS